MHVQLQERLAAQSHIVLVAKWLMLHPSRTALFPQGKFWPLQWDFAGYFADRASSSPMSVCPAWGGVLNLVVEAFTENTYHSLALLECRQLFLMVLIPGTYLPWPSTSSLGIYSMFTTLLASGRHIQMAMNPFGSGPVVRLIGIWQVNLHLLYFPWPHVPDIYSWLQWDFFPIDVHIMQPRPKNSKLNMLS